MSTDKATGAGIVAGIVERLAGAALRVGAAFWEGGRHGADQLAGLIADTMSLGRRTALSRPRILGFGQRAAKPR
ncbi:hypothetical protein OH799_34425 [Nocardia sp. NBC_00881]|uniref:hypothetical protein n=1 Tax=Nocardia sp. NBC_00881 TaxID=2975995 RepID=UPI00386613D3|nr:hypothetical protein OH799_34425 [Nocardia sp. NBC_00881]